MDPRKVDTLPGEVKRAWEEYVLPFVQDINRARMGQFDTAGATAYAEQTMSGRSMDPEVWASWGHETARRYCLHDSLNVPEAVNLDHRAKLLMYPEGEWREVIVTAQRACMTELCRLWPAIYGMRLAAADGPTDISYHVAADLSRDLSELPRIGSRIAAYQLAGQRPIVECDGRFLRARVNIIA